MAISEQGWHLFQNIFDNTLNWRSLNNARGDYSRDQLAQRFVLANERQKFLDIQNRSTSAEAAYWAFSYFFVKELSSLLEEIGLGNSVNEGMPAVVQSPVVYRRDRQGNLFHYHVGELGDLEQNFVNLRFEGDSLAINKGLERVFTALSSAPIGLPLHIISPTDFYQKERSKLDVLMTFIPIHRTTETQDGDDASTLILSAYIFMDNGKSNKQREALWRALSDRVPNDDEIIDKDFFVGNPFEAQALGIQPIDGLVEMAQFNPVTIRSFPERYVAESSNIENWGTWVRSYIQQINQVMGGEYIGYDVATEVALKKTIQGLVQANAAEIIELLADPANDNRVLDLIYRMIQVTKGKNLHSVLSTQGFSDHYIQSAQERLLHLMEAGAYRNFGAIHVTNGEDLHKYGVQDPISGKWTWFFGDACGSSAETDDGKCSSCKKELKKNENHRCSACKKNTSD